MIGMDWSDDPEIWDRIENDDLVGFGAFEEAADAMAERMEYELRGAWRAGYDYVHVYDDVYGVGGYNPEITLTQYVLPSNVEKPPRPDGRVYRCTYDLSEVPDDVIRDAIRGELDEKPDLSEFGSHETWRV